MLLTVMDQLRTNTMAKVRQIRVSVGLDPPSLQPVLLMAFSWPPLLPLRT